MANKFRWSTQEERTLEMLIVKGCSYDEIGAILDRSAHACEIKHLSIIKKKIDDDVATEKKTQKEEAAQKAEEDKRIMLNAICVKLSNISDRLDRLIEIWDK